LQGGQKRVNPSQWLGLHEQGTLTLGNHLRLARPNDLI
jgi:hypothetical protein